MLQQRELGQDVQIRSSAGGGDQTVDLLGPQVPSRSLQKHRLVEAPPDALGGVDEVLDSASDPVDLGPGGVEIGGEARVFGGGEGVDGGLDGGEVGVDGLARGPHGDDGIGGFDEVAVALADELAELLLLLVDLLLGLGLDGPDLGDGLGPEEGLGISVGVGGGGGGGRDLRWRAGGGSHGGNPRSGERDREGSAMADLDGMGGEVGERD